MDAAKNISCLLSKEESFLQRIRARMDCSILAATDQRSCLPQNIDQLQHRFLLLCFHGSIGNRERQGAGRKDHLVCFLEKNADFHTTSPFFLVAFTKKRQTEFGKQRGMEYIIIKIDGNERNNLLLFLFSSIPHVSISEQ